MICGFDYGTSNCALGIVQDSSVRLVALEGDHTFLPSTLYALDRDLITEAVGRNIQGFQSRQTFAELRQNALTRAKRARYEEDIADDDQTLFFGRAAFDEYFQWPEEGYFVKSPKSFLGGAGLRAEHIHFF